MAFKKEYDEKLNKSVEKHSKPKGVTLEEIYEIATPEERKVLEDLCARVDEKEAGPPPAPPMPPPGMPPAV